MIKSKEKSNRTKNKETLAQVILGYGKTVLISFTVAAIFTTLMSIHARNEMIKNLYENESERKKMDELVAKQLVAQADLSSALATKNYAICMQVGSLYESALDYPNAEFAYRLALEKAKNGVYAPYSRLATVMIAQGKYEEAEDLISSVSDVKNKNLIKFKSRIYVIMGDKYYSEGKFLKAARSYEKAKFYYDRFSKRDKKIDSAITERLVRAYVDTADVIVKNGYNSDAVRFLKKAEHYAPNDKTIRYKLAIVYSDLDPILSVDYFEKLLEEMPQHIDYTTYNNTLMKAANIADLEGNPTKGKYYRYRIHSIDLFVNQKVIYKNDVEVLMNSFSVKNILFKYRLKSTFRIKNVSHSDIYKLSADFILRQGNKERERYSTPLINKNNPLFSNGGETKDIEVKFGKNIFTKRELADYEIDIYLYKDSKYKTLVATYKLPQKSFDYTEKLK